MSPLRLGAKLSRFFFLRDMKSKNNNPISATPATDPTTLPTIVPVGVPPLLAAPFTTDVEMGGVASTASVAKTPVAVLVSNVGVKVYSTTVTLVDVSVRPCEVMSSTCVCVRVRVSGA